MNLSQKLRAAWRYAFDRKYRFMWDASSGKYNDMPDEEYLRRVYDARIGWQGSLREPLTFNEKLQYLKLYDRNPVYTTMVDKVAVKDFVAARIGQEYIIPTLGVWTSPEEIDFEALPSKFVLKCNHNSGLGMCICNDRTTLDIPTTRQRLAAGLAQNYYLIGREWPYRDVPRKILAEQFLENDENGLTDYKLHCFNGIPRFVLVCRDRFAPGGLTEDFFTPAWEHMPVKRPTVPQATAPIPRPEALSDMLSLAEKLSRDIPFLRVDFYCVEGKLYFSELTLFPATGFAPFDPPEWDRTFGDWLTLPPLPPA